MGREKSVLLAWLFGARCCQNGYWARKRYDHEHKIVDSLFFCLDAKSAEKCFKKLQKLDVGLDDSFTDELFNRVHGVVKAPKSAGKKRAQEAPKKPSPKVTL